MRGRFGRGRRPRGGNDRAPQIDAGVWLPKLGDEPRLPLGALTQIESEEVPGHFALLASGASDAGATALVAFAPRHAGDALLAGVGQAQAMAEGDGFSGDLWVVAPQWSIAARRRLGALGELPFTVRALAIPGLEENGGEVEVERAEAALPLPAEQLSASLEDAEQRTVFARALAALEGLAAKHGGAVRGASEGVELVLLARRVALLRVTSSGCVLETVLPDRSSAPLSAEGLAAAFDRMEGQLRKRINDRRVRSGEEGLRFAALSALAETAGLRSWRAWPIAGSDPEVVDAIGVDAEGRPALAVIRESFGLSELGAALDAMLAVRGALPLLVGAGGGPVRADAARLLIAAETTGEAVVHALGAMALDHALYDVQNGRGGAAQVVMRGESAGAPRQERPSSRRRRRGERRPRPAAATSDAEGNGAEAAARDDGGRARAGGGSSEIEEMSLFDLDEEGRSDSDAPSGSRRRRRRGRRRGRRPGAASETADTETPEAAPTLPSRAVPEDEDDDDDDDADLLGGSEHDPGATLSPMGDHVPDLSGGPELSYDEDSEESSDDDEEDGDDDDWVRQREARMQERLARATPEPEPTAERKAPRRRAAVVAHADRDSVLAAILLARDIRLVEGFWIYPQDELMTFFRSVATDLGSETPIHVVGFTARPARDTLQAASLYRGRLSWYDHHDWPPEDLDALRSSLGEDSVEVEPGGGSSLPAVLANRSRRSRFSDKLVELGTGRFSQHDYERWGRVWWHRLGELVAQSGERRARIDPLLGGRPSDLAREAARAETPALPPEVGFVSERDFRVVHFGGWSLVVLEVPEPLDLHLCARIARERFDADLSLARRAASELVVLAGDETARGRRGLDLNAMLDHLAAKHEWLHPLRSEDHVCRLRVSGLDAHPQRLEDVVADVAMGRSILEG